MFVREVESSTDVVSTVYGKSCSRKVQKNYRSDYDESFHKKSKRTIDPTTMVKVFSEKSKRVMDPIIMKKTKLG